MPSFPCVLNPAIHVNYSRLGSVDLNTVEKVEVVVREEDKIRQERFALRPPMSEILTLHDFEVRFGAAH